MTDDVFGFGDPNEPRNFTPPAGYEVVHRPGMTWPKQGASYETTSRVSVEQWTHLIAQFRGLGTLAGVSVDDLLTSSPLLLREFIVRVVAAKVVEILSGEDVEGYGVLDKATYDPDADGVIGLLQGGTGLVASSVADLCQKLGITAAIDHAFDGINDLGAHVDAEVAGLLNTLQGKANLLGAAFTGPVSVEGVSVGVGYQLRGAPVLVLASGAYNRSAGCRAIFVRAQAAGAGGGGARTSTADASAVGGSGGGGVMVESFVVGPAASYPMIIGAGGSRGIVGGSGGDGGDTSFGSLAIARGGKGGSSSGSINSITYSINGGDGGLASESTGNVRKVSGGTPANGQRLGGLGRGAASPGGSAGDGAPAVNAPPVFSGSGGISGSSANGQLGTGGSGAVSCGVDTVDRLGGIGGNGYILVWEYF